jgi:hypothetical protein
MNQRANQLIADKSAWQQQQLFNVDSDMKASLAQSTASEEIRQKALSQAVAYVRAMAA